VARLKTRLPGALIMRSVPVVDEESIVIACNYQGNTNFLLLDSIGHQIARSVRSVSPTISRLAAASSSKFRRRSSLPEAWGQKMLSWRSAQFDSRALIQKRRPTWKARTGRISIA
jgi:hypothetical protein